jgi:hypothetical protein
MEAAGYEFQRMQHAGSPVSKKATSRQLVNRGNESPPQMTTYRLATTSTYFYCKRRVRDCR